MSRRIFTGVGGLAAASLLLESAFLRLLSVAQFYHFAFLVVSLALLGFGASGSLLAVSKRLQKVKPDLMLPVCSLGFAASVLAAYGAANYLPFDSFTITWDPRQMVYFALYFLALALPFVFSGLGIGACLAAAGQLNHQVYAANLIGSALGVLLGLASQELGGVPGAVLGSLLLVLATGLGARLQKGLVALAGFSVLTWLATMNAAGRAPLGVNLSPYKGLAYARQYPGADQIFGGWSAISRVDVLVGAGTRYYPGLSYTYQGELPLQAGLSVDGETLQPVSLVPPDEFFAWSSLPEGIAFSLRPDNHTLVLEPGAGLGVLQALAGGAGEVTAVLGDPLIDRAVGSATPDADIFRDPRVNLMLQSPRVFLEASGPGFDLVTLPLVDAYRPVSSGAYSLAEAYMLTVEGVSAALDALNPEGILVATRWLQTPPSEGLRLIATIAAAQGAHGREPASNYLVAYRGIQTITVLTKNEPWAASELAAIRAFLIDNRFDLVWAPDILPGEANRNNKLPEPEYYLSARAILDPNSRPGFFAAYPYAVQPATDDRPFFFHFFTWKQTPEVLTALGKIWAPFGGSGYFVLLAMLLLVTILGVVLILAPVFLRPKRRSESPGEFPLAPVLSYFGLLGVGFLFIEIPLIQKWILILGHPNFAFVGVVFILLAFSSLGSRVSRAGWISRIEPLGLLAFLALGTPWLTSNLIAMSLGWSPILRVLTAGLGLAPLAFLMGIPFPKGLAWLEAQAPELVPWAWAVNGCVSVIAAVLAALLSLSFGFSLVLFLGAAAYIGAWLVSRKTIRLPG